MIARPFIVIPPNFIKEFDSSREPAYTERRDTYIKISEPCTLPTIKGR